MPEVQGLSPAQMKVSYIFLTIGAMTLAFGIYMGSTKESGSLIAIVLLCSVVLFVGALWPFLKLYKFPTFNFANAASSAAKTEPQPDVNAEAPPEAKTEIQSETKTDVKPDAKAEVQTETKNEIRPEVKTEAQPEVKVEVQPEAKAVADMQPETKAEAIPTAKDESQPKIDAKTDVAKLMNTPLGELLLAALIKDPESAGRFVAQAISQAERS